MKPRKLSRREFTRAIKNGLGSAVLHIKEYGDKDVQDILMQACAKNYIFIPRLDRDRSLWLFQMLIITGNATTYAEHIETCLTNPEEIEIEEDLEQLIKLASYYFKYGYQEFRPLLLTLTDYPHDTDSAYILAEALTDMYSFPGFIMGAKLFQKTMNIRGIESWRCHTLFLGYACRTLDSEEETKTKELLAKKSKKDELIAQYWQELQSYIEKKRTQPVKSGPAQPDISIKEILTLLAGEKTEERLYSLIYQFCAIATENDRQLIMAAIDIQTSEEKLAALLQMFWKLPMPYLPEHVESLTFSTNERVRLSANNALRKIKHDKVRALALKAIESKKRANILTGIRLLENNYLEGDITLINSALPYLKGRNEKHMAAFNIIEIAAVFDLPELREILLWAFNHNPCGICRQKTLKLLIKRGQAPDQLLFEAQWDVDDRVNVLAREAIH
jgi:hypothetical protein